MLSVWQKHLPLRPTNGIVGKGTAIKPDDLNSIPRILLVEGGNPHIHTCTMACAHMHTLTQISAIKNPLLHCSTEPSESITTICIWSDHLKSCPVTCSTWWYNTHLNTQVPPHPLQYSSPSGIQEPDLKPEPATVTRTCHLSFQRLKEEGHRPRVQQAMQHQAGEPSSCKLTHSGCGSACWGLSSPLRAVGLLLMQALKA